MKQSIKRILHKICPIIMTKYYYKKILGRTLNLKQPMTLNEKVNWLKLYYWPYQSISSILADKYSVRDYVNSHECGGFLNELIGSWDDISKIDWEKLPKQFAIKCGHGCGMNIVCYDKNELDRNDVLYKLDKWMHTDWGIDSCEPHYSNIKPMIICEKFLGDSEKRIVPDDIKIHCFNGEPKLIAYYSGRDCELHSTFYDIEWNHLDIATKEGAIISKPRCLEDLLFACKKLAVNLPYARIDFYIVDQKPIFGEITLTPASGRSPYMTEEADKYYGSLLDLSELM